MNPAPSAVRAIAIGLGVVLVAHAVRTLVNARRTTHAVYAGRYWGRVSGALVCCSTRVARRTGVLHRRNDDTLLITRLAVAPRTWPARAVAAAAHRSADAVAFPDTIAGVRLLSAICLGVAAVVAFVSLGPTLAGTAGALSAVAGAFVPDLVLARAAYHSLRVSRRDAARTVDVLAAAVSAGHSLRDALDLTAAHAPPALAAAVRSAGVRLSTGIDPATALAAESDRFDIPVLADIGAAADRQRRLGFPLGPELCHIAARHRAHARADLLARATRRGPLGTLMVALVIAPVCIAALTACLVGGLVMSGGLATH